MAGWIMGVVAVVLGAMFPRLMVPFFGFAIWFATTYQPSPTPSASGV